MKVSYGVKLNKISLNHKAVFDKYLSLEPHELSVYAFENIYIWKALFEIEWSIINNSLCIFFKDKFGSFLYLSPLSEKKNPRVLKEVFSILDGLNENKEVSRIENIEKKDSSFYEALGYVLKNKSYDYLCLRTSLASLSGNKFKSKRANFNYFIKNYKFEYLPFSLNQKSGCLNLYDDWMMQRKSQSQDRVYLGMLEDGRRCLKLMLNHYSKLGFIGRIVKINKEIKAFTFGFKLNNNTFCILYEITDLSIKGLAQFIFAQFCRELKGYKYINIMDDSGLENLKKVKLSYCPAGLIPAYIADRKNE
jgi:hypothetical protein